MVRPQTNYWIDILLVISGIVTTVTSLVLFFFLPSGPRSSQIEFLGILKHGWSTAHTYFGLAFIALVLVHFILHWKWLWTMTGSMFKKK